VKSDCESYIANAYHKDEKSLVHFVEEFGELTAKSFFEMNNENNMTLSRSVQYLYAMSRS